MIAESAARKKAEDSAAAESAARIEAEKSMVRETLLNDVNNGELSYAEMIEKLIFAEFPYPSE